MVMSPPPWEHAIPHHQRLLLLTQLLNEKGLELSNAYDCCRGSARVGQQGHKPRDTHCVSTRALVEHAPKHWLLGAPGCLQFAPQCELLQRWVLLHGLHLHISIGRVQRIYPHTHHVAHPQVVGGLPSFQGLPWRSFVYMADIQVCAGNLSDAVEPRIDKDPLVGDSEDASKDDLPPECRQAVVVAPQNLQGLSMPVYAAMIAGCLLMLF
mmetsp:Transcript_7437/g.19840  ORF Transcript_7437/g.19840 Transcript_7437/m.19840 type:complete len:210 (-) Transcript_7437:391-1020(-)